VKTLGGCILVAVVGVLAAGVDEGRACSCALPDPRAALAQGGGAFVGKLVSRRDSGQQAILTFSVDRALKGSIGRTVEVVTASNSAACGIEIETGSHVGLVLDRRGDAWQGYLCSQFDPEELLAAALPLPVPNGRGDVALILGAELGDVRLLALDARGRTLAYGRGGGRAGLVSLCPGRRRLAELAYTAGGSSLVVREARTLRILRRQRLRLPGERYAQRLRCEDGSGQSIVLFARGPGGSGAGSALLRVAFDRLAEIWTGAAHDAAIGSTTAYLSGGLTGRSLLRVDLVGRRVRRLATLPGPTIALSVDKTGTVVAGVHARLDRAAQVVRVDLRSPTRVRTVRLPADEGQAQVLWLARGRLLFVPAYGSTARVLDASLRTRSRFRWKATTAALVGPQLYGIDISATLFRAALPSGPQRLARRLPGRPTLIVSAID
jgi:hypothetical protein